MIVYQARRDGSDAAYIGKTTKTLEARKRRHAVDAGRCLNRSVFHKAIRKYGVDAFVWEVLGSAEGREQLNTLERECIAAAQAAGRRLYNLTPGGDGGGYGGEMSPTFGRSVPGEQRAKISESLKKYYATHPNPMQGVSLPGRPWTKGQREALSRKKKGVPRPDMLGSGNPSARAVRCETTGEEFATASQARDKYGIDLSSIIKCCRGKAKTAKGLVFTYTEEPGVFGWTVIT